jgi:transposase
MDLLLRFPVIFPVSRESGTPSAERSEGGVHRRARGRTLRTLAWALIADRGYDARAIIDLVESRGGRAHIPTCRDRKVQRSVDHALYRERNLIERFFNKLKHFRRIATRYDKTARNFLAAVMLAATRLWARFESTT